MKNRDSLSDVASAEQRHTFSLVLGGPLFQLLCRARLCDDELMFAKKRVLIISLLAWLPLLILSVLEGNALSDKVSISFLLDFEAHLRFLVAIPLFIIAEILVHRRLQAVVREFFDRELIPVQQRARFFSAIGSALRLQYAYLPELLILIFVYAIGILVIWNKYLSLDIATWYATPTMNGSSLSIAGIWYEFVSLPIFQFLMLRWLFRVLIWWRFVWQVSRIKLCLLPTHPDRAAGIGFLTYSVTAFAILATAHTTVLSGQIANRIFYQHASLLDFKLEIAVVCGYLIILFLSPLLFFIGQLAEVKRAGLRDFGKYAQYFVKEFDIKWLQAGNVDKKLLLSSSDVQSLADLGNAYDPVRTMRLIPVTTDILIALLIAMLIPIAPLLLTLMPLEELAAKLFGILF